jgi:hypothetical protein
MDTARERFLACLLGGSGAIVGVLGYQAIPDLIRFDFLVIEYPNAVYFLLMVFAVGGAGGLIGHWAFLRVARGPIEGRALFVGGFIGLAIAIAGWTLTFVFEGVFFPFRPFEGMSRILKSWLPNALMAGPIGGILAASMVVRRLRRITGKREPLE